MGEKAAAGIEPSLAHFIRLVSNFQTRCKLSYYDKCISSALIQDQSLRYPSLFLHFCDYLTDSCCGGMASEWFLLEPRNPLQKVG